MLCRFRKAVPVIVGRRHQLALNNSAAQQYDCVAGYLIAGLICCLEGFICCLVHHDLALSSPTRTAEQELPLKKQGSIEVFVFAGHGLL